MAADRKYNPTEKRDALTAYVVLGSYLKAEKMTGVPWQTIASWKHQDAEWWNATANDIIAEIDAGRRAGKLRTLGKAIDVIEDRLDNGNHVLAKDGTLVRVPVPLKDAVIAFGVISDKSKPDTGRKPTKTTEELEREFAEAARLDRESRGVGVPRDSKPN